MRTDRDVVIIGGGVQGLSLAYHLAKLKAGRLVVIDHGYPGGGASGRNGEMIRSAFASEAWIRFFDLSLRLWEDLSGELDYNVMFTRCGYLVLASTDREREICRENVTRQHQHGLRTVFLTGEDIARLVPALEPRMAAGGVFQPDGGFAHHDAVVWAYLRAARRLGIECRYFEEVVGIEVQAGAVRAVLTTKDRYETRTVVNAAGGHAGRVAALAGVRLPSRTYRLEMIATEPLKPFLRPMVASLNTLSYMHQTTRGEFVGGAETPDLAPSQSLRSSLSATEDMATKFVRLFPGLAGVRLMRQWAGLVDMAPDVAPMLGPAPEVRGFFLDCGWVYGFAGAPASGKLLAEYIVAGTPPPEVKPFTVQRFQTGRLLHDASLVVPSEAA
ncbi:MAG: FAD-binding oxidoreductase [Thermodesulfobacteriota bacterium]